MGLNEYFDNVYCINLKHREDRWENCKKQFDQYNINVEKFEAVNGKEVAPEGINGLLPGEIGVIRSNYNVIKDAKEKKYKNVLIFEDDVELCEDFNDKFTEFIKQVPNDWSFLYLGGNHVGGYQHVTENVAKIRHSFAIHAFVVNENVYDHILELLPQEKEQVDVTYAKLQNIFPSYVFRPHLAWQRKDFSDIQGGVVDYEFLKR